MSSRLPCGEPGYKNLTKQMIRARLSKVLSHTFILYMQKWVIFWCFLVFRFAKPPFKKKRRKHRVVLKIENNEFYWPPFESLDSKLEWQSKLCDPYKKKKSDIPWNLISCASRQLPLVFCNYWQIYIFTIPSYRNNFSWIFLLQSIQFLG